MKVFWTTEAEQDRDDIWNYIAVGSPAAAADMDQLFSDAAAKLEDFPHLGQAGAVIGTRELIPHESYRLVYEVTFADSAVWVLALVHTSRQWPPVQMPLTSLDV